MVFRRYRHIIIFICLVSLTYIIFTHFNWPGKYGLPFLIIPVIYFLIHFVRAIILLFKKRWPLFTITLFSAILFLLPLIRLSYTYYNIGATILILTIATCYDIRFSKKTQEDEQKLSKGTATLTVLIFMNLSLVVIPYKITLGIIFPNYINTWRQLSWSDFNGPVPEGKKYNERGAISFTGFDVLINKTYNYPPAIVKLYFDTDSSWVRTTLKNDVLLLQHEQGHFDIADIFANKAQIAASHCWGKSSVYIDSVVNQYRNLLDKEQNLYDSCTKHGIDTIEQKRWLEKIKQLHTSL